MKYIKQFLLILAFSFLGELCKYFLPFPVPASIYGLVFLFLALETGVVKLSALKETAGFLIEVMPLLFIPAGAGLINAWGSLKPVFVPFAVIVIISTFAVMAVSGRVTQFFMRKRNQKGGQ